MPTRKVVFVLDDDIGTLKGIERLLRVHGFESELFDSIDNFHNRASLHKAICLVLDINLNGMSGIELRRQLAISGIALPVIFITANDSENTRKAAMEVGCVAYLTKPFPAKLLIDAIERASGPTKGMNF